MLTYNSPLNQLDRALPNSHDAERAILGGIILNPSLINRTIERIGPEVFYSSPHRHVFFAMISLFERGVEVNPILIAEELKKNNTLESVGGISFITNLTYGLPHSSSICPYIDLVVKKRIDREVLKLCEKIHAQVIDDDVEQAIPFAITSFNELLLRINGHDLSRLRIVRMLDIKPERVKWLWDPYIPLAKLTLLEGDPGIGKSWITAALAAAVSIGSGLPGMEACEFGNVLMLSAEDGLADTLRPRLDALGADVSKIFGLAEPLTFDEAGLNNLNREIAEKSPRLVTIDPLFAFTGGKVDINRANECRAITARLSLIAEKHNCAILAVRHLNKSRGLGHALNAGIGSIDITAAARSVLLAGKDPNNHDKLAIVQIKSNLAASGAAVGFTLAVGQFAWTGESDLTPERILSYAVGGRERSGTDEAVEFLREALSDGERETADVVREAKGAGISQKCLRSARERLKINTRREGSPGTRQRFFWALPRCSPGHNR